jgi:protein SCO1/2
MADVGQALRESDPDVRAATQVVFVTSDPARDTPSVMQQWLSNFDSGLPNKFIGLTASNALIDSTAKKVGVPLEPPVKQKNGTWTVDHGAQVLAFQNGQAHLLWLAGTTVADYKHDFTQLVEQQPTKGA